jgi:hypothetical protein
MLFFPFDLLLNLLKVFLDFRKEFFVVLLDLANFLHVTLYKCVELFDRLVAFW